MARSTAMLALVTQKAQKSQDLSSVELVVDLQKGYFASMQEREKSYCKLYCYNLESMATTLREYKTIRMSEFFPMADTIVNPHFTSNRPQPELTNDQKVQRDKMDEFIEAFRD